MASVPSKVAERLSAGLRTFQKVLQDARQRDINEADTAGIIKDMLADIWGYDKYTELTSEHQIRGTYCDIAVQIDGEVVFLIEAKAIGLDLKDQHVKQAVDYAANKGIEWVALTNGHHWHLYRVSFGKPIEADLVVEFDLLEISARRAEDIETLFMLSREGLSKSALEEFHTRTQAMDKFLIAAVIRSDACLQVIRRELRRVNRDVKITTEEIDLVITEEVLKREVVDGDKAEAAARRVDRASSRALRSTSSDEGDDAAEPPVITGD